MQRRAWHDDRSMQPTMQSGSRAELGSRIKLWSFEAFAQCPTSSSKERYQPGPCAQTLALWWTLHSSNNVKLWQQCMAKLYCKISLLV